jgi:predicted nucleic acid-binding protein
MPEIICDCCCISNFALSDSLSLLKCLYNRSVYITDFVSAEILRGIQGGHQDLNRIQNAVKEGWLKEVALVAKEEKSLFQKLSVSLGLGEASSIAVAKIRGFLFACDDKAARREAGLLGVKLTGTLGLLKRAVLNKSLSLKDGNLILAEMISKRPQSLLIQK